ncbi:hypothetical protein ACHAXA_006269 [Cyclostephanos tholiformis]|uniref:Uncharacterized protein n=1 Tax=Cyclostephanos tholiformis TaxID=382380 RepID=A0ABD3SPF2_9STRA
MNLNSDETDDDESKSKADKPEPNSDILEDDDQGESKADKPKPNSEAVEDGNDKPLMGYGPPYDDEKVRLFVLEYLGIDPDQFPYMSKEEREKALKMMDGILNIDLGSGGGDGMTPLLSDVNPTGEDNPPPPSPTDVSPTGDVIVYDPAPPTPTDVSPTGDVIVYDPPPPSPTDGWNLDGSCKEGVEFQLESFEDGDGIIPALNGVTAMRWTTMSIDPWSQSTAKSHDGRWSTRSGITQSARRGAKASTTVYSNITLTTEAMFKGGVLTFKLYAESLGLPREALFVIVDGKVESTIGSGSDMANGQWVEYSVAVGYGAHDVTFSHAYNPFGLESLPQGRTEDGGLWMDDVRYAPFMTSFDMSQVDMINGGCISTGVATPWKVESGGTIVSASSSDIKGSNSADISFTVYTEKGGMLTYSLYTSTTGPHDDFAILLNNGGNEDTVATADFGDMRGFESKSLSVPKGKVTVVLQHRKDPGRLGSDLLGSLGQVVTDGVTRLNDLRFQAN